jgi:hypothetical protein
LKKIACLHVERKIEASGVCRKLLTFELFTPDSANVALDIQQHSVGSTSSSAVGEGSMKSR